MQRKLTTLSDNLSDGDAASLNRIRELAKNLWARDAHQHPYFTLHGDIHCQQIARNIDDILALGKRDTDAVKKMLDPTQSFYLLASVWLHDVGMIVPAADPELKAAETQGLRIDDWIRENHHTRSRVYVKSHAAELGLRDHEAAIIGQVCEAHRKVNLTDLPEDSPNPRVLAALLRAADELDITRARAPKELMELLWDKMEPEERWNWLKHFCVADRTAHYEQPVDEGPAPILQLSYHFVGQLPDPRFRTPFWDRVVEPIRDVLETQHVNLILRTVGVSIMFDRFRYTPQYSDITLHDGTKLGDCLGRILPVPPRICGGVAAALRRLERRIPEVGRMLQRECVTFSRLAGYLPNDDKAEAALEEYIAALAAAPDLRSVEHARDIFKQRWRDVRADFVSGELAYGGTEREWLRLADLGWRLLSIVTGDDTAKMKHLMHLLIWLPRDANDVASWVAQDKTFSPSLRCAAVAFLAARGNAECYNVVLTATTDHEPSVRMAAVSALRRLRGPGTLERLGQIIDRDVDGEVRETARTVLHELTTPVPAGGRMFEGRKILLADADQCVISALVDELKTRSIEVRVETNAPEWLRLLHDWDPDLVICELLGVDPAKPPHELSGLELARLVRLKAGKAPPLLMTSLIDPEEIAAQLADIGHYMYIRKPTSIDSFIRTIEGLLSWPSHVGTTSGPSKPV